MRAFGYYDHRPLFAGESNIVLKDCNLVLRSRRESDQGLGLPAKRGERADYAEQEPPSFPAFSETLR